MIMLRLAAALDGELGEQPCKLAALQELQTCLCTGANLIVKPKAAGKASSNNSSSGSSGFVLVGMDRLVGVLSRSLCTAVKSHVMHREEAEFENGPEKSLATQHDILHTCLASLMRIMSCLWLATGYAIVDFQRCLGDGPACDALDDILSSLAMYLRSSQADERTLIAIGVLLYYSRLPAVMLPHQQLLLQALGAALSAAKTAAATNALLAAYFQVACICEERGGDDETKDGARLGDYAPAVKRRLLQDPQPWAEPAFAVLCAWLQGSCNLPQDGSSGPEMLSEAALDSSLKHLETLLMSAPDADVCRALGSQLWDLRPRSGAAEDGVERADAAVGPGVWGPDGDVFHIVHQRIEALTAGGRSKADRAPLSLPARALRVLLRMLPLDCAPNTPGRSFIPAADRLFQLTMLPASPFAKCMTSLHKENQLEYALCCEAFGQVLLAAQRDQEPGEANRAAPPPTGKGETVPFWPFWHEEKFLLRAMQAVFRFTTTIKGPRGGKADVIGAVAACAGVLEGLLARPWPLGERHARDVFEGPKGLGPTSFSLALDLLAAPGGGGDAVVGGAAGMDPGLRRVRVLCGARCVAAAVSGLEHLLAVPEPARSPGASRGRTASALAAVQAGGLFAQRHAQPPDDVYAPDTGPGSHLQACIAALADCFVAVRAAGLGQDEVMCRLVFGWQLVVNASVRSRLRLVEARAAVEGAAQQSQEHSQEQLQRSPRPSASFFMTQEQSCALCPFTSPLRLAGVGLGAGAASDPDPENSEARGEKAATTAGSDSPPCYPILEGLDGDSRGLVLALTRAHTRAWALGWVGAEREAGQAAEGLGAARELFLEAFWWLQHRFSAFASVADGEEEEGGASLAAALCAALPGLDPRCLPPELLPLSSSSSLSPLSLAAAPLSPSSVPSPQPSSQAALGTGGPRLVWFALLPSLCHADMSKTSRIRAPTSLLRRAIGRCNNGLLQSPGIGPALVQWMHAALLLVPAAAAARGESSFVAGAAGGASTPPVTAFAAHARRLQGESRGATPKKPHSANASSSSGGGGNSSAKPTLCRLLLCGRRGPPEGSLAVLGALWRGLLRALHSLEGPSSQEPVVPDLLRALRLLVEMPLLVLLGGGGLRGWWMDSKGLDGGRGARTTTTSSSSNSSSSDGGGQAGTASVYADMASLWLRQERSLLEAPDGASGGSTGSSDEDVPPLGSTRAALGLAAPGGGLGLECSAALGRGEHWHAALGLLGALMGCLARLEGESRPGPHAADATQFLSRLLRPRMVALLCVVVGSGALARDVMDDAAATAGLDASAGGTLEAVCRAVLSVLRDDSWGHALCPPAASTAASLTSLTSMPPPRAAQVWVYCRDGDGDGDVDEEAGAGGVVFRELHRGGAVETCLQLLFDAALGGRDRGRGVDVRAAQSLLTGVSSLFSLKLARSEDLLQRAVLGRGSFVHALLDLQGSLSADGLGGEGGGEDAAMLVSTAEEVCRERCGTAGLCVRGGLTEGHGRDAKRARGQEDHAVPALGASPQPPTLLFSGQKRTFLSSDSIQSPLRIRDGGGGSGSTSAKRARPAGGGPLSVEHMPSSLFVTVRAPLPEASQAASQPTDDKDGSQGLFRDAT